MNYPDFILNYLPREIVLATYIELYSDSWEACYFADGNLSENEWVAACVTKDFEVYSDDDLCSLQWVLISLTAGIGEANVVCV